MRRFARTMLALAAASGLVASVFLACAKGQNPMPAVTSAQAAGGADGGFGDAEVSVARSDSGSDAGSSLDLRAAVVREAWSDAQTRFAALPAETQKKPAHRYLAAKIAWALGHHEAVLASLETLENDLPELRDRILAMRAEAADAKGLVDVATEIWLRKGGSRASLRAARAYAKVSNRDGVLRAVRLVLTDGKRTQSEEAEARALRASVTGDRDDARWLALHAPTRPEAALPENPPLSEADRRTRIEAWARAGNVDEALRELESAEKAGTIQRRAACSMRATILYGSKSKYGEAATAHANCAALGGKEQPEHLFYEARALSRANQDDLAIRKYSELSKRFPRSPFAAQALQLRARLLTLNARYDEAAKAWDALPASDDRNRLRGLSHLLAGHAREARDIFEKAATSGASNAHGHAASQTARLHELHALAMDAAGDKAGAIERWKAIVRESPLSYASLVARARLSERNVELEPPPPPPSFNPSLQAPLGSASGSAPLSASVASPALQRSFEFAALGLGDESEALLRQNAQALSTGAGLSPCDALAITGRAKERFRWSSATSSPHENDCRYPTPFLELVSDAAGEAHVPVPFVYAIMRTESAFDPEVHSPAAAVGLMQLLPDTAKKVGEKAGLPAAPLEDPRTNIYLGARYLADLQDELKAPLALVAAAYNAGPEAILRWLSHLRGSVPPKNPNATPMDVALFCELIPYSETRAYVFQVMESYANYANRAGARRPANGASANTADAAGDAETRGLPRFSLALPPL